MLNVDVECRKEHDDAQETADWIDKAGRKYLLLPGDLAEESTCKSGALTVSSKKLKKKSTLHFRRTFALCIADLKLCPCAACF